MKKNNLLIGIMITFLVVIFLSWVVPNGSYYNEEFTKGNISPLGLADILVYPIQAFGAFVSYGLPFLLIGGLYGVLNKTGVYSKIVNKIIKKLHGKENIFLFITIGVLALLTSVTGLTTLVFILVPFFATILMLLGYKKITAMTATIGAILVGVMAPIITSDGSYMFSFLEAYAENYGADPVNYLLGVRIILFVLLTGALAGFTWLKSEKDEITENKNTKDKKETKNEKEDKKEDKYILYTNYEVENKSSSPLIITIIIFFVVALLGMIKWYNAFNIDIFSTAYTSITDFKIAGYPIVKNIVGSLTAFGTWDTIELSMLLIIFSSIIGWLYSIKFKDMYTSFIDGAKKMLPTAIYVTLASVIMYVFVSVVATAQQGPTITGSSPLYTIINKIIGSSTELDLLGLLRVIGMAGFGSLYLNDFGYLWYYGMGPVVSVYSTGSLFAIIGLIYQTIYGLLMMVLPTSMILIAGLSYFEIPYKQWLKKNWQYILTATGIILFTILLVFMFMK